MPSGTSRSIFIFLLLSFITLHGILTAQDPGSFDAEIDRILKSGQVSKKSREADNRDSVLINEAILSGKRFRGINRDSCLFYLYKAINISLQSGFPEFVSISFHELGDYYVSREMYSEAMSCYLKSLRIEEARTGKVFNRDRIADLYDDLGTVYYFMEIFNKSLQYHESALKIYHDLKDTLNVAKVLNHLGSLHSSREFCERRSVEQKLHDFNLAISYYEQSIEQCRLVDDENGIAKANQNIAAVYNKLRKPEIALGYVNKANEYFRRKGDPEGTAGTLLTAGRTYYRLKDYNRSIESFIESEKILLQNDLTEGIQYLYEAIAMSYYDIGDYKNAYHSYIRYMTIRDSVFNAEKSRQVFELEAKYQSSVKQNEILRLTSAKQRKNTYIYLLLGIILILVSATSNHLRILKKNKIISEKDIQIREEKILDLQKEKQLLASRSVLDGEEAERLRIATDLHNGLGGLLTGIKLNLSSMKENIVMTQDNVNAFSHAISLLDTSISELRRIAHNLMPETLSQFGLKTAIEDFCTQVSSAKHVLGLQFFGEDIRYSKEFELSIYRISQELINNALKHSGADRINVQLISERKRICVQVTDNGVGFNPEIYMKNGNGKGIRNIRNRITALNGRFDIWSQPGKGAEISVEINIPQA